MIQPGGHEATAPLYPSAYFIFRGQQIGLFGPEALTREATTRVSRVSPFLWIESGRKAHPGFRLANLGGKGA